MDSRRDYVTSFSGNGINGYRYDPDCEIHGCKLDSVMHSFRTVCRENIRVAGRHSHMEKPVSSVAETVLEHETVHEVAVDRTCSTRSKRAPDRRNLLTS